MVGHPLLRRMIAGTALPLGLATTLVGQADSVRRDTVQTLPSLTVTAQRRNAGPYAVPVASTVIRTTEWQGSEGGASTMP